ncbi:MAG: hypothetical protein ACREOY_09140 [Candidatus Dormibacteraceae bacterium]
MVNYWVGLALATAGWGLWEIVTGRPPLGAANWPLQARATRWGGAYTLTVGLVVAALALSYPTGLAFGTYAILVLAFAAAVQVTRKRPAKL